MRKILTVGAVALAMLVGPAPVSADDLATATPAMLRAEVEALALLSAPQRADRPSEIVRAALARLQGASLSPTDRGSLHLTIGLASSYFTPRRFSTLLGKDPLFYFQGGSELPVFAARAVFAEEALKTVTVQNAPADWALAQSLVAVNSYEKSGEPDDAWMQRGDAVVAAMLSALPRDTQPEGYLLGVCARYHAHQKRSITLGSGETGEGAFDNVFNFSARQFALANECFARSAAREELNAASQVRTLAPIMLKPGAAPRTGFDSVDVVLAQLFNPANIFDFITTARALQLNGAISLDAVGLSPQATRRARELRSRLDGFATVGAFHTLEAQRLRLEYVELLLSAPDAKPAPARITTPAVALVTFDSARAIAGARQGSGATAFIPTTGTWTEALQSIDPIEALSGKNADAKVLVTTAPTEAWMRNYNAALAVDADPNTTDAQVAAAFNTAIEAFRAEFEPRWSPMVFAAAERAGAKPGDRLVIYPDGAASMLPIGMLRHPRTGKPFAEEYEIVYAPSPSVLARAEQRAAEARPRAVAFVAPGQEDLAFTPIETALVAKAFGVAAPGATTGSRAAVLGALKGASYWHFATHGGFFPGAPLKSGLAIQQLGDTYEAEKILSLGDMFAGAELAASPRLVVLSACETGLFDATINPDEFLGLPSGFLALGAAGVVASQWKVDDAATSLLMGKFYELHLAQSKRPSEALRLAQTWLKGADKAALATFADDQAAKGALTPTQAGALKAAIAAGAGVRPFEQPYFWGAFTFYGA